MAKRSAVAKFTVAAALAVLIFAGAAGMYYYTSIPSTVSGVAGASSYTSTGSSSNSGPGGGSCQTNGQGQCTSPQGAWAEYLGYIPAGYNPAPHYSVAAVYQCPAGMNPQQCQQFQATCGNGVCDPNESCASCKIDCGIAGSLTCDPYTGRAGGPVSVCQLGGHA